MTFKRILGILLIVLGLLALAAGGIGYTTRHKVIDVGPIQASADERHWIPFSPIVGIVAVGAGVTLLAVGRRERV